MIPISYAQLSLNEMLIECISKIRTLFFQIDNYHYLATYTGDKLNNRSVNHMLSKLENAKKKKIYFELASILIDFEFYSLLTILNNIEYDPIVLIDFFDIINKTRAESLEAIHNFILLIEQTDWVVIFKKWNFHSIIMKCIERMNNGSTFDVIIKTGYGKSKKL